MIDPFGYSNRKLQKQSILFEAALDVFAEFGFRKAGVEEIARRAGIANGTIYLYATSKRDLYRRVVEYGLGKWQTAAAEAAMAVGAGPDNARARFETLCRSAFTFLKAEPRLRRILAFDPSLFPASLGAVRGEDPFEIVNRRSVEMLKLAIVDGIQSGEFAVSDPTAAAELIFSLYRILIEKAYVAEGEGEENHFEAGLGIILNGITVRR